jgi:mannobiose 2-epimerase
VSVPGQASAGADERAGDLSRLQRLRDEMAAELTGRILPFWAERTRDDRLGGFVGWISADGTRDDLAPKGTVLGARLLWTFSAASRVLGDPAWKTMAERARAFLRAHMLDREHGGVFWMVDADGTPRDTRKHVYAQAFAIYALAEHHRATGNAASLQDAISLFELVDRHAHDPELGGYEEAFTRDWVRLEDVRLSDVDANERKSMNTHLHVLEAYTTLYRAWPESALRIRLQELVGLFIDHVVDAESGHVIPFFDADWTPRSRHVSYGHDIETSWLLMEAVDAIGDLALRLRVQPVAVRVARAVLEEGFDAASGGIRNAAAGPDAGARDWWPQAEAIVGFVNAWELTGEPRFLDAAVATWEFTSRHLLDRERGEWFWGVSADGLVRSGREKVGPWKCSYHNSRACMEVMARADYLEP